LVILSAMVKVAKNATVKMMPEIVATCLVTRLMQQRVNKIRLMMLKPRGNSHLPNLRFSGTRNSRPPGCL